MIIYYFIALITMFLFSEISKFLINDCNYVNDKNIQKLNHILEIRKEIFSIKRNSLDIKQLYQKQNLSQYKNLTFNLLIKKLYCSKLLK